MKIYSFGSICFSDGKEAPCLCLTLPGKDWDYCEEYLLIKTGKKYTLQTLVLEHFLQIFDSVVFLREKRLL